MELAEQAKVTEQRLTQTEQQLVEEQQKRQQLAEQLSQLSLEQLQVLGIDPILLTHLNP